MTHANAVSSPPVVRAGWLRGLFGHFAGLQGTTVHGALKRGGIVYHHFGLRRPLQDSWRPADSKASPGKLTGESRTGAITRARVERLTGLRQERNGHRLPDELEKIAQRCAGLPVKDARPADEILGYDASGLPR